MKKDICIRDMRPDETKGAVKLARKSFGLIEGFFASRPKLALVAVIDDKIVGGLFYKIKESGGKKFGYIDYLFTDPAHQGHGIGKRLNDECIRILWEQGCDVLMTYVQDDNVASWKQFFQRGFVRSSWPKMIKLLGLPSAVKAKLLFASFGFSVGYEFYIALPDKTETLKYEKKTASFTQIFLYLLTNLAFASLFILRTQDSLSTLIALVFVFIGSILIGYVGVLFSARKWHYRLTPGGSMISLFAAIVGFFPINGNWYPDQYENTPKFKRDMAINSIAVWLFFFITVLSLFMVDSATALHSSIADVAASLMILRLIPLAPINSYGARRIIQWNKVAYALLVVLTVIVVFVLPRLIY